MKRTTLFAALALLASPALAADIPAASKITKVTVYADRALVTRSAEIELPKGEHSIVFADLPAALLEDSLRAEGRGTSPVELHGAEIRREFIAAEADPRVAALTAEVEKLEDEKRALDARRQGLDDQRRFLDSIRDFSSVQIPKDLMTKSPEAAQWPALAQSLLEQSAANGEAMIAVERQTRDKDKEIEAKRRALSELWGGAREKKTAVVNVASKADGKFTAEISYVVPQAQWTLSYDARVYPDKKTCTLVSYGNVRQWTGEDWDKAKLTLSSAKPSVGGRMPELSPWFVNYQPPAPEPMAMPQRARMTMLHSESVGAYDALSGAGGAPEEYKAAAPQAAVSQELGSVTFEIARPATVTAANQPERFPVLTEEFKLELDFETTPKLSPYVYLHSKVANDKDHALPPGELSLFANDAFVGKSSIGAVAKGESFDLYLGLDEDVKVKRTELKDKRKKTMLGLRARKDWAYRIEVENYKKEPVRVKVIDQLPVPGHADIKTGLGNTTLKPDEKDLGRLEWSLELPAGGKQEFEFEFFLEFPSDKPLYGI